MMTLLKMIQEINDFKIINSLMYTEVKMSGITLYEASFQKSFNSAVLKWQILRSSLKETGADKN